MSIKKLSGLFILINISIFCFSQQSHMSTQSHQSAITSLSAIDGVVGEQNTVFSSGEDGFLIKWTPDGLGEHFQITEQSIKLISRSPNGNDIAVYTTDGASTNMVSIWNFKTLTRKYAYKFSDPITSLTYSSKGTYVICGTASVKGTYFLNTNNGQITSKKLKESTGPVSMIVTSATENTAAMYSPAGTLTYYNLKTGDKKARFNTVSNLTQTGFFNNSVFMAGIADSTLYVIQATTGSTVGKYPLNSREITLITSNSSQNLYYIVTENRQFKLYLVQNDRNKNVIQPELIRTFTGIKQGEKILTAIISGESIFAGTNQGNLYKFDYAISERVDSLIAMSENMYDHILDVSTVGDNFYFLTPNAIFLSSYDNGIVDRKGTNPDHTNIITYNENVILWSKDSRRGVQLLELSTGTLTTLFTPGNNINTLKLFGDNLIWVEGHSNVCRFKLSDKSTEQLYIGTGIQDAILYGDQDLYIAKTSATNPTVPFIHVNTRTKEVVPLSLKGNVAYSLSFDPSIDNPDIYGILISYDASNNVTTSIFDWNPQNKTARTFLQTKEEDGDAFSYLSWPALYTNIGKSQVRSYNVVGKRNFEYKRSASLPLKVAKNNTRLVVLNRDGSISWYNPDMNGVIADWYLTIDGQWFEF